MAQPFTQFLTATQIKVFVAGLILSMILGLKINESQNVICEKYYQIAVNNQNFM